MTPPRNRRHLEFYLGETVTVVSQQATADSSALAQRTLHVPKCAQRLASLAETAVLLRYSRPQRRQLNPWEEVPHKQKHVFCMSHDDIGALLAFAVYRLRRGVLLHRAAGRLERNSA